MRSAIAKLAAAAAIAAALLGTAPPAQAQLGTIRFDNWGFYQQNFGDTARWQYRARFFIPYKFGDGWTFTQRLDLPFYYTDATGPGNPSGGWKFGASDFYAEEIFDTPDVAKNFRLRGSVRFVFPTGGQSPFGSDQWQVAPGFGANWRLPDVWKGVTIAPYARYFYGFDPKSPGVTTKRSWNIFPEVDFTLNETWQLLLWPEQGVNYNVRTGKWFVPVEAMLSNRVSKTWGYGFGGAYEWVNQDNSYRWIVQGRVQYFFQ